MQINFRTEARPASKPHTYTHMPYTHAPHAGPIQIPHGPHTDPTQAPRRHSAPAEGTARRFITPQNAVAGQRRNRTKENRVADIYNAVSMRSEADAINLNQILPILILFYLYINILQLFFINCEVWKFSKIRSMYDKCMTKMITFAIDKTS